MAQLLRVLVADDNAHARAGLRALLATWPEVEVVGEAADGQEAVRLVAEHLPDIVVIDLQMPVLDGAQATRMLKQRWPSLTVIVLTLYAAEEAQALAAGADAFVVKGVAPDLLAAIGLEGANAPADRNSSR
jgi:DNA-binding NarL/FixJ family response regulator